ncbi:MAG: hypothetical protein HY964_02045, partial [Ignavibacteriales bacterium]|nr:hypothetical protein [Ignavibacteriales bacterium]
MYYKITLLLLLSIAVFIPSYAEDPQYAGICGTPEMDTLTEIAQPEGFTFSVLTTRFWIHYKTSGPDATTAAYAESVGVFAEYSWTKICDELGWLEPASDNGAGGDSRYDIYIRSIGGDTAAYTTPYSGSTYITVRNNNNYTELRLNVAHEFHHASQFSYCNIFPSARKWYREGTAVWMSVQVYPSSMIYYRGYIIGVLGALGGCHQKLTEIYYGGALWWEFLTEWTSDPNIVKSIWEEFDNSNGNYPLAQTHKVLSQQFSTTLTDALKQFALWRNFTSERADAWHFSNGSLYSDASINTTPLSIPFSENNSSSLQKPSGPGGVRFWKIDDGYGTVTARFDGQNGKKWAAYVIGMKMPEQSDIYEIPLTGDTGRVSFEWASADSFVLVTAALDTLNANDLTFSYDVTADSRISVTFTNKIGNGNAYGKLFLDNVDTITSGQSRLLNEGSSHSVRTLNERFVSDSTYKHLTWNNVASEYKMEKTFNATSGQEQDAIFIGLVPATIQVEVSSYSSLTGGKLQFRDPWYLDSNGTQPSSFFTYTSPYSPTGAYNQSSGGVFMNQTPDFGDSTIPYYSVKVESTQIIEGFECTFSSWYASGAVLYTIGDIQGYSQRAVKFTSANAVVKAIYTSNATPSVAIDSVWNMVTVPVGLQNYSVKSVFPNSV